MQCNASKNSQTSPIISSNHVQPNPFQSIYSTTNPAHTRRVANFDGPLIRHAAFFAGTASAELGSAETALFCSDTVATDDTEGPFVTVDSVE